MALVGQWIGPGFTAAASTTVADESGNGNTGTLAGGDNTNTIASTDRPGTAGTHSLDLDGTNDRVTLADFAFGGTSSISVMGWCKADTDGNTLVAQGTEVILRQLGTGGRRADFILNSFTTNDRATGASNTAPALGTWYHLAGCYDGSTIRVYVDGTQVATATPTGTYANSASSFEIGATAGGTRWNGLVWDVRIYDTDESANLAAIMAEKDSSGGSAALLLANAAYFGRQL
jgi:hypothetical protein